MNQFNDNGLAHGYWEEWRPNGTLWYKGDFNNGLREGYWQRNWYNDNLHWKGYFINSERHGYWEFYDNYGKLEEKEFYL